MPRPQFIEALEPRRMLAVITGTNNSDTIQITREGSFTHVIINGADHATTDTAISVSALGGDDFVLMDYVAPGIVINLGADNDRVTYGGPTHDIFGDLPQTLLEGDVGTDTVVFDDSGGPANTPREYLFTDLAAMNQVLFNFERLEIKARQHPSLTNGSDLQFTGGFPVSQNISITTSQFFGYDINFGTQTQPIDLNNYSLDVNFINSEWNDVEIFDQDSDFSGQPFRLYTSNGRQQQHLAKGAFHIAFTNTFVIGNVALHGGSTNDSFGIGDIARDEPNLASPHIEIFGGGGDDSLYSTNDNGHLHDWDEVNIAGTLTFRGEAGIDSVDLDDSSDQAGDNDQNYFLNPDFITKSSASVPGTGRQLLHIEGATTERINLVADADNNTIKFATGAGQIVTADGGTGNDTFMLHNDFALQDCRGTTNIIGGNGNDLLTIADDDPSFQEIREYSVVEGSFVYADTQALIRGIINFDSTVQTFTLDENDASAETHLLSKLAGVVLQVNAAGGNDTFFVGNGDIDSRGFTLGNTTLSGGAGTDLIHFDDHSDTDATGEIETYTFGVFTLAKGSLGVNYNSFESQILDAANGVISGQFNTVPTININAYSGQLDSTTINGGAARSCIVNVTQGNLTSLGGALTFNLPGGIDTVIINDQNSTVFPSSYQVASNALVKGNGQTISYSGPERLTLNASNNQDSISVNSVAAGMAVTVNSNAGNDTLLIGNGNISATLLGSVVMNGGLGTDTGFFSNTFDNAPSTHVLNGMSLTEGGMTHSFTGLEALRLNEGPGGTNLTINSTSVQTNVNGNSGNDTFIVGGGDIDANFPSGAAQGLFIDGAAGNDSVLLNDLNDTGVDTYNFQRPNGTDQMIKDAVGVPYYVSWAGIEGVTLDASNAPTSGTSQSPIIVFDIATPLRINGNDGSDWVIVQDSQVPVFVNTGTGTNDQVNVNHDLDGVPVTVVVDQNDEVEALNVFAAGTLRVTNGATLVKTRAATSPGTLSIVGVLDLAGGSFLSRAGGPSLSTFQTFLTRGFNLGSWNGTNASGAINSSLAAVSTLGDGVGLGMGSQIGVTGIGPFVINATDALLRYTLNGDSNLDAVVDVADLGALASNWQGTGKAYTQGDSNFDAVVDVADLGALASNWQQSVAAPSAVSLQWSRRPKHESTATRLIELT